MEITCTKTKRRPEPPTTLPVWCWDYWIVTQARLQETVMKNGRRKLQEITYTKTKDETQGPKYSSCLVLGLLDCQTGHTVRNSHQKWEEQAPVNRWLRLRMPHSSQRKSSNN